MTDTADQLFGSFLLLLALGVTVVGGSLAWILWQDDRYGFPAGSSPWVENYGSGSEYGSDFQSCRPISKDKR